jgi:hypothetical protein
VGGSSLFPPTQDVPPGGGRRAVGWEAWWGAVVTTLPLNRLFSFFVAWACASAGQMFARARFPVCIGRVLPWAGRPVILAVEPGSRRDLGRCLRGTGDPAVTMRGREALRYAPQNPQFAEDLDRLRHTRQNNE